MAILVGIDEAGYGPILGPLVVSATAFELPDAHLKTPLWDLLRASVCNRLAGAAGRIAINDSKKLHSAKAKYHVLQRSVLACLAAVSDETLPETFAELLHQVEALEPETIRSYPWYQKVLNTSPLHYDREDIVTAAGALKKNMDQAEVRLLNLWSRPLLAGEYNRQVDAAQNKATVLFSQASYFIDLAFRHYGQVEKNLQILIDKHGGRSHYRAQLQRLFPHLAMKIIKEDDAVSSYEMSDTQQKMKIHFVAKGDDRYLPIALASMLSKLLRELFMEHLNAWFVEQCPDIKPTAGYYKDGTRFLSEIDGKIDPVLIPQNLLVRSR